jgi:MFS transporter, ACS family, hexuronate transporter
MTVAAYGRHVSGPLAPFLKSEFGLTETQIGLIASAIFLGAITSGIPGGLATDRFNARWLSALAFSLLIASYLLLSRTNHYWLILAIFVLSGISTGLIVPVTDLQVVRRFPRKFRLTALGIKQMGSPLGAAFAAVSLPLVALHLGLSTAFIVLAMVTSTGLLLTKGLAVDNHNANSILKTRTTMKALSNPRLFLLGGFGFGIEGLPAVIMTFLLLYYVDVLEVPIGLAGLALAVVQLSGALGRAPWGAIGDRWFRRRPYHILGLMCILASSSVLLLPLLSKETPLVILFALSVLLGVMNWGTFAIATGVAIEIGGEENAGAASSLVATLSRTAVVVWPPIFGAIVVATGSYHIAWVAIVLAVLPISLITLFLLNITSKGYNNPPAASR